MPDDVIRIAGLGGAAPPDDSQAILALRERAATALERALAFVSDHGDQLATLRAHVVLEAVGPDDVIQSLSERQLGDGSCPPLGFVFSSARNAELRAARVDAAHVGALETFSILADVRGLTHPVSEKLVAWATGAQNGDGSWGYRDPVREADDPEGSAARAADDRLFVTGMLGGFALRTPFVRPEVSDWAGRFLSGLWAPERVEGGRISAIAAFASFFANGGAPDLSDEAMQWCGRELERGFRAGRFECVEVLRVLFDCDAEAMPGASFDVVELLDRLLAEQAGDGGFAELDPGGPSGRVAPSLDALIGIRVLCRAL